MPKIQVQYVASENEDEAVVPVWTHDIATHVLVKHPSTRFGTVPLLGSAFELRERVVLVVPREAWLVDTKVVDLLRPWLEVDYPPA